MTRERRSGPAPKPEAAQTKVPTTVRASMAPTTDSRPALDGVDAAGIVDGVLVLVVRLDVGVYRRRVFLTVASAERAAQRARARGQAAEVVLARLAPVALAGGSS